ncbi:hypothetical protein ACH5RR_027197 [Cinchona calisaya]|uniref:Uncharacterized protein n=1 Tax=Cinchona calisaya TaxID=153742 RepID=A0ABD2Z818_9GENT
MSHPKPFLALTALLLLLIFVQHLNPNVAAQNDDHSNLQDTSETLIGWPSNITLFDLEFDIEDGSFGGGEEKVVVVVVRLIMEGRCSTTTTDQAAGPGGVTIIHMGHFQPTESPSHLAPEGYPLMFLPDTSSFGLIFHDLGLRELSNQLVDDYPD